ncbi:hypothetical protein JOQ06_006932, partial [Pogonophryne albipinna]
TDRDILKKEITAVKEELHLKHQTILGLKEQLQSLTARAPQRPQPATSNTQLTEPRSSTSSLLLQPSPQPSTKNIADIPLDQSHPPRTRAIQARQASTTPINSRPTPGYQPCPPFQQPAQKSYATALKTPPNIGRNGADLGEERQQRDSTERQHRERQHRETAERETAQRDSTERERQQRETAQRDSTERQQTETAQRDSRDSTERQQRQHRETAETADRDSTERDSTERETADRDSTERQQRERDSRQRQHRETACYRCRRET